MKNVFFRLQSYLSLDGIEAALPPGSTFVRTGCMAAFDSFEHFEQYSDEIFDLLEDLSSPAFVSAKVFHCRRQLLFLLILFYFF